MRKISYSFLDALENMPPLVHAKKGEPFDITKSEVAKWIVAQPEIMQKIFDLAVRQGVIVYDPKTGTWQGVGHDGD